MGQYYDSWYISLTGKNWGIWKIAGSSWTVKVTVPEQTKIGQQLFRKHATTAPYQVFCKNLEIILRADELIYFKYIIIQSFKIAWKLCIKISFGTCGTQLDVFWRDFRSLPSSTSEGKMLVQPWHKLKAKILGFVWSWFACIVLFCSLLKNQLLCCLLVVLLWLAAPFVLLGCRWHGVPCQPSPSRIRYCYNDVMLGGLFYELHVARNNTTRSRTTKQQL